MTTSTDRVDSDSGHSPSDDEKRVGVKHGDFETLGHGQLPPDPDAHLSPEERAAIVCSIGPQPLCSSISWVSMAKFPPRTGSQTPLETRPPPGKTAKSIGGRPVSEVPTHTST